MEFNNARDPDYSLPVPKNQEHQLLLEKEARTATEEKIIAIVEREFSKEIEDKKSEISAISTRINKCLKLLHYLRYAAVTSFYNKDQCLSEEATTKQSRIHPAVKSLIEQNNDPNILSSSSFEEYHNKIKAKEDRSVAQSSEPPKKVPRYIPPKEPEVIQSLSSSRGGNYKVKRKLVVGNISKWIPLLMREGDATHKWTLYVTSGQKDCNIGDFVSKVRFLLDPSYKPNDLVEVSSPPFYISRRGWGEFEARVQIHFKNVVNKPVDIRHQLKLDKTFTGLQTMGGETLYEVCLKTDDLGGTKNVRFKNSPQRDIVQHTTITPDDQQAQGTRDLPFLIDHNYASYKSKTEACSVGVSTINQSQNSELQRNDNCNVPIPNNQGSDNLNLQNVNTKQCPKLTSVESVVRYLVIKHPVVTKKACDPKYKANNPYACESIEEFCSYSLPKRKAIERFHATAIHKTLKPIVKNDQKLWTIKEIISWCKQHAHIPITSSQDLPIEKFTSKTGNFQFQSSCTTAIDVNKWLSNSMSSLNLNNRTFSQSIDDNMEIDVDGDVGDGDDENMSKIKEESETKTMPDIFLESPKDKKQFVSFVIDNARNIGVKLSPEELVPGVLNNTAALLIVKVVENLMEDILRSSYACSLEGSDDISNLHITRNHVFSALLKREEFDIFTNEGLGSQN